MSLSPLQVLSLKTICFHEAIILNHGSNFNFSGVNKLHKFPIYPLIKFFGLLGELLSQIIKLLIHSRIQCDSQFYIALVLKRTKKTIRWNILLYNSNMDIKSSHYLIIHFKNHVLLFVSNCSYSSKKIILKIETKRQAKNRDQLQSHWWDKRKNIHMFSFTTIGNNVAIWWANAVFHKSADNAAAGSLGCTSWVHNVLTTVMTNNVVAIVQTTIHQSRFVNWIQ